MNKYEIIKKIGDGTFGSVYEGITKNFHKKVAIKQIKQKLNSYDDCLDQNEVKLLLKLNNENIIRLIEVIQQPNKDSFLIFEYCNCSLYDFMRNYHKIKTNIPINQIKKIIYQISSGLNYLHSHNIMHRDLKPENILMIANNNKIKIADFGSAKEIKNKNGNFTDYICTRWYRAPECVLKSKNYDEKVDIWALGCIMAELYNLKPLFPGNNGIDQLDKICMILGTPEYDDWVEGYKLIKNLDMEFPLYQKKNLKYIIKNIDDNGIDFLNKIFQFDPMKRPTASELLNHPYLNEMNNNINYDNINDYKLNNRLFEENLNKTNLTQNGGQNSIFHFENNDNFFNKKPCNRSQSSYNNNNINICNNNEGKNSTPLNDYRKNSNHVFNETNYNGSRLSSLVEANIFQNNCKEQKFLPRNQSYLRHNNVKCNMENEKYEKFFNIIPNPRRRLNLNNNENLSDNNHYDKNNFGNYFFQ